MANVQIRNVPDKLHQQLKHNAAYLGMSLSDYLLRELNEIGSKPTMEECIEQLKREPRVHLDVNVADLIREERENR